MDHPSRFCFVDNSGNTDYSELHRWSPHLHSGYKSPAPADNSSYIYTSDYGSYSSQESNHSGTTYSNLADCEEALNSPYATAYDLPPPELYNSMDRRRDKPLPPPRMTSRTQAQSLQRVQPPVAPIRQKKISFDDSTMIKSADTGVLNVPSFATLPRKKKLVNSSSTNSVPSPAQSNTQVTWMKEVAQKGDSLTKSKSTGTIETNKKPQGILKNKLPLGKTHSDTNGYIKRDTVQKILDQQRKAINRQSSPNQFYKSLSLLPPNQPTERQQLPAQRAWEYNYGDKARSNTATVIGIFEPNREGDNMRIINHSKQRSDETEFEFPPPPTDQDIAQIMNDPVQESSSSPHYGDSQSNNYGSNSINLTQEQSRGRSRATSSRSTINRSQSQCDKDRRQKPQVPQRPPKHVVNGHTLNTSKEEANRSETLTRPHIRPRGKSCDRMSTERRKVPFDQRVSPFKHADNNHNQIVPPPRLQKPHATTLPSKLNNPKEVTTSNTSYFSTDIVLPPPAEFMGSTTHLATNQPSYGDYELLSPEAQYEKCDLHPTMSTQSTTESNHIYNKNAQRTIENGGQNSPRYTPRATYHQKPHVANNPNTYQFNPNYATILGNHRHQYSTEL